MKIGDEIRLDPTMPLAMAGVRRGWIMALDVPVHGVKVATGEPVETRGVRVRLDMSPVTDIDLRYDAVRVKS